MKSPPNNEAQYTATLRVDHYFFLEQVIQVLVIRFL